MPKLPPRSKPTAKKSRSSSPFQAFAKRYPAVAAAYEQLGDATQAAGPLDGKQRALAKLAIAIGAFREGATHSHTRRALEAGCSVEEIRHVVVLATTTLGFPSMMATMTWVDDVLRRR
jgi:alkylhydroperoxidase/carboxymuconolactone decarboxylase family protein YurZ